MDDIDSALGAARSEARKKGNNPEKMSGEEMYATLDDISRQDSELAASKWYMGASDKERNIFFRRHEKWKKGRRKLYY